MSTTFAASAGGKVLGWKVLGANFLVRLVMGKNEY